ncbi:MAG: hypothetical protein IJ481_01245, partial [Alphaproteobacteria bacterium]|nr:hypothetical protein [Alphaproteobacteria bacterium]
EASYNILSSLNTTCRIALRTAYLYQYVNIIANTHKINTKLATGHNATYITAIKIASSTAQFQPLACVQCNNDNLVLLV